MTITDIKKKAAKLIKNNYKDINLITILILLSLIIFAILPFIIINTKNILIVNSELIISLLSLIGLIYLFIANSYFAGEKSWYSGQINGSKLGLKRLFFWFKPLYSIKASIFKIYLYLIKTINTIIFITPSLLLFSALLLLAFSGGIEIWIFITLLIGGAILLFFGLIYAFIFNQRYFLAEYLYINNPKLSVIQVINRSKNLLDGHIFNVVKFKISFLPHMILCLLIIPIFVIGPYYKQSCSIIAKELCI